MMSKFLLVSAVAGGSTTQHYTRGNNKILRTEVDVDGDADVESGGSAASSSSSTTRTTGARETPVTATAPSRRRTARKAPASNVAESFSAQSSVLKMQHGTNSKATISTKTTRYTLPEVPICEDCGSGSTDFGDRAHECWTGCGAARGYCDKCNSAAGSRGACCMQGNADDPAECQNAVEYPAGDPGSWHVLPRS